MEKYHGSMLLRKQFELAEDVKSAELSVCALGLGTCSINGQPVTEDVLTTPYTVYDKRVIYRVYDVTKLLKKGANAIGAYVGNGFYNDNLITWNDYLASWKDVQKLFAHLRVVYESGREEIIRTDNTWRGVPGPSTYNHMRQGEIYDASLEQPGYDTVDFDDSEWKNAKVMHEPGGIMETVKMPPIRVTQVLQPVAVMGNVYDFGVNISGWARITASGEKGQQIKLIYDEVLNDKVRNCVTFGREANTPVQNEDILILSGRERDAFRPTFTYHGFRYVTVENAPEEFTIVAEFVHTDLPKKGSFVCDDEMLNKIHEASVRATLSNYVGIPTDCPHREQNGWTGDALLSSDQALMNFEMKEAYAKWLRDFKDVQRPNGQLPGIVPSAGWGYNWGSGPAWDSALILIPWAVYVSTGDKSMIEEMWENMVRYMEYFERMSDNWIANFGLGDWCPVHAPACSAMVTDTAYFYVDCLTMGKMAKLLGHDETVWFEKAVQIKKAWREKFWGKPDFESYQVFWACAIYQGLLEPEEIPRAAAKLADIIKENGYHVDCGILGIKYMFSALSDNGYMDVLYRMVTNPEYPSYAYWILQGNTTLCEDWKGNGSHNHHMFSEVDNWLYRHVGGIRITEEGVVIQPMPVEGVNYVCAEHAGIKVERNGKEVKVTLPVAATVIIEGRHKKVQPGEYTYLIP